MTEQSQTIDRVDLLTMQQRVDELMLEIGMLNNELSNKTIVIRQLIRAIKYLSLSVAGLEGVKHDT